MEINFSGIRLSQVSVNFSAGLFQLDQISYKNLKVTFQNSYLSNNSFPKASFFSLTQNSQIFAISNVTFINNTGQIFSMIPGIINDPTNLQGVQIMNSSFRGNNGLTNAIFIVSSYSFLQIFNSTFIENYSTGRGSVFLNTGDHAKVEAFNSTFISNYANLGGIVFSSTNNDFKCNMCLFADNFAFIGGIVYNLNDGQSSFLNCTFHRNIALQASLAYSINSMTPITFEGGLISQNGIPYTAFQDLVPYLAFKNVSESQFAIEKRFSSHFILILQQNSEKVMKLISKDQLIFNPQIQIIKSSLRLGGGIEIQNQTSLLSLSETSKGELNGVFITNIFNTTGPIIQTLRSYIYIENLSLSYLKALVAILQVTTNSVAQVSGVSAFQTEGPILTVSSSQMNASGLELVNATHSVKSQPLVNLLNSKTNLSDLIVENISVKQEGSSIIQVQSSSLLIDNIQANNFQYRLILAEKSNLLISNSKFVNSIQSFPLAEGLTIVSDDSNVYIQNCSFNNLTTSVAPALLSISRIQMKSVHISNSIFTKNKGTSSAGAIMISNQNAQVDSSIFDGCLTNDGNGGAMILSCIQGQCSFTLKENTMINNRAGLIGGAIYYDLIKPVFQSNLFLNNSAQYGKEIGSYASYLDEVEEKRPDYGKFYSGITLTEDILIAIKDQNGQVLTSDSSSECSISSPDLELSVVGQTKVIAQNGICSFSQLSFLAKPFYSTFVVFTSSGIDQEKQKTVFGVTYSGKIINFFINSGLRIDIYFRKCLIGEVQQNNQCIPCLSGTYSFSNNETRCSKCFDNTDCLGRNITSVRKGFWRSNNQSKIVSQCPNSESCLQGLTINLIQGAV